MTKSRALQRCQSCGATQGRWAGRCDACGEWNSLREEPVVAPTGPGSSLRPVASGRLATGAPVALGEVDLSAHPPMPTGLGELDRVLAGGLLPGSATLLGGEPGTGKSTLLLQALAAMASGGRRCLLVAAEESAQQVRRRAGRLGTDVPGVFVVEATLLAQVEAAVVNLAPDMVVVDSVQAISDGDVGSPPGSLAQVRACSHGLVALAKASGAALVLVGHVTKDGALAGPRALEHLVDTVLSFEGDRYSSLRVLRAVKHRFGPTGEMGLFEMGEKGLVGVPDPSSLFLGDRLVGAPGSALTVPVEGYRPLVVEVQALVGRSSPVPRRFVTGLDPGRVGFLVAVLEKRAGIPVGDRDVYVSVAGGARACEPAADLAVCLALASSLSGQPLPAQMVALGEVGLGGELRRVNAMAKRLAEARRLGFGDALVPASAERTGPRLEAHGGAGARWRERPASTLGDALAVAWGDTTRARRHDGPEGRVRPGPLETVG